MKAHLLVSTMLALVTAGTRVWAVDADRRPSREREWLDRPWEIRYVLFVDGNDLLKSRIEAARDANAARQLGRHEVVYLSAAEMFEPTLTTKVPGKDAVSAVLIQFDKAGHAQTKSARLRAYTAKRNMLDDLVVVRTTSPQEIPYYFALWSQGIPGAEHFSPAVCADADDIRYEKDWRKNDHRGGFGCREWTAQLYRWERPYINVTSYQKDGSFIGDFVGWARFTDPPKPVIGLQGKTWLCLHECPGGEAPGIIPDIKAWTAKHHFPIPQRPPKQPEYPDSDYQDDLNE